MADGDGAVLKAASRSRSRHHARAVSTALPEVEERQRKLLSFARDEAIGESTSS